MIPYRQSEGVGLNPTSKRLFTYLLRSTRVTRGQDISFLNFEFIKNHTGVIHLWGIDSPGYGKKHSPESIEKRRITKQKRRAKKWGEVHESHVS